MEIRTMGAHLPAVVVVGGEPTDDAAALAAGLAAATGFRLVITDEPGLDGDVDTVVLANGSGQDCLPKDGVTELSIDLSLPLSLQILLGLEQIGPRALDAHLRRSVANIIADADAGSLPRIVSAGDPVLRRYTQPWRGQLSPKHLRRLIQIMRECMHDAPGVGLAAPQIGVNLQLAVLEDHHVVPEEIRKVRQRRELDFLTILNPEYRSLGADRDEFYEGCLSVPGWQAVVARYSDIELTYLDEQAVSRSVQLSGWPARIAQHETDHLKGLLYLDKAETRSLVSAAEYQKWWSQPSITAARIGLAF